MRKGFSKGAIAWTLAGGLILSNPGTLQCVNAQTMSDDVNIVALQTVPEEKTEPESESTTENVTEEIQASTTQEELSEEETTEETTTKEVTTEETTEEECTTEEATDELPTEEEDSIDSETGDMIYGDFQYNIDKNNGIYITKYTGSSASVTIPASIADSPVYKINGGAFADNTILRSVTIPATVYELGSKYDSGVFNNCINLQTVIFQTGGTKPANMYAEAFRGCKSIGSISIPDNYEKIEENAFYDCVYLSSVKLPKKLRIIGGSAFRNTAIKTLVIPEQVQSIREGAFCNCKKLTSVTIPSSVTQIGDTYSTGAFENCTALAKVTIKAGQANSVITNYTFKNCWRLESISIPGNYVEIGKEAFYGCKSLTSMSLGANTNGKTQCIADNAFKDCVSLKTISLPKTLQDIGYDAFRNSIVTAVVIPEGVKTLAPGAFYNCTSLKTVSLPKTLKSIGSRYDSGAFENCTNLTTVTMASGGPENAYLGAYTFKNDAKLTSISIPGNYSKIDVEAFYGCTALKTMKWSGSGYVYPNQVLEASTFTKCHNLASISLPNTLLSIGSRAFEGSKISTLIVPDKVQVIEYGAFANCKSLVTVTLPSGLTRLGGDYDTGVFENCNNLVYLTLKPGEEQVNLGGYTFKGCTSLKCVIFPENYANLGKETFANCTSLKVVYIEDSGVIFENQKLRNNMFYNCSSLRYMYVPKSVGYIDESFGNKEKVVFYGVKGSYAQNYAKEQGIPFNPTYGKKPVVSSIKLSKTSATVSIGYSTTVKAAVAPDYTPYQNVKWTSSNPKVAKVNYKGKITGVSKGSATITCTSTDGGNVKQTCKVTVTDFVSITGIKLSKSSAEITKGAKLTLKATITPSNATNKNLTWKSSNTKVATVSSTGVVTGVASGTATITCTAKDGSGKKATCTVTVYTNTEAYVARIYTKALGRTADLSGLKYWAREIDDRKRTPVEVAESFFFSNEFTSKNLTNTEFVKVLYRTFMGREADQGGLNYWVGRLNKGESRKTVLESFAACDEFKKIVKSFGL